jgi:hypothetical protein
MTLNAGRRFRWAWIAFLVVATSVPYVVNWFYTPPGYRYMWILPPDPEDSFAYMAWAQQAARGALLFKIKYTALPHAPFLFHPFFLVCGWLSAIFSCDIGIMLLILKALGVAIFFLTFYRYADYLGLGRIESTAASILLGIASGFGGIFAGLGSMSESQMFATDLSIPEMTTYYGFLWNPLFPFSLTLILLSIFWLDRGTRESQMADIWRAGIASGVLATIHPYFVPMVFAFAIVVAIVRARTAALGYLVRYFAAALPLAVYEGLISVFHPIVSKHSALGEMKSPPLLGYFLGFGLPLLLFVAALIIDRGRYAKRYWQIVLWFVLCLALAYLPVWFQRKLIFGAQVPLCIMAGVAVGWIATRLASTIARRVALSAVAVILLPALIATPVYLLVDLDKQVKENIDNAYFENAELVDALKALKKMSKRDDIVFAEPATSRLIPALSGNTTIWGHWAMSVDYDERRRWLDSLLHPTTSWDDKARAREFWGTGIEFVLADKGFKRSLDESPYVWRVILEDADKVFENPSVVIYRHRKS